LACDDLDQSGARRGLPLALFRDAHHGAASQPGQYGAYLKGLSMATHLLRTIREEHQSLTVMLDALQMVIRRGPGLAPQRFFEIVRTMLVYVKEFSEHVHYPKETQLVFPKVLNAAHDTQGAIAELEKAHRRSVAELGVLQSLLEAWQKGGPAQGLEFERAALRFCDDYRAQIRMVEAAIIPVAEQLVSEAQWETLAQRYQNVQRPEPGLESNDSSYQAMYTRIALWLTRFISPARLVHK
jgi:hemerythrin-like domain-containing protein